MTYRLVVTGASSEFSGDSLNIPTETGLPFATAKAKSDAYRKQWNLEGFHLSASGIFVRGLEWRKVSIYPELEKGDQ